MRAGGPLLDPTNTVALGDARAVARAIEGILDQCFGAGSFDAELLHASVALVERLFAGEHPGYLACDMPYHDLRHSLDTALVMARLVDGFQREHRGTSDALTAEDGLLGVLLGLLHDSGFIRRHSETALCGPQLMPEHEARSVAFAAGYLRTTSLAGRAALSSLILATRLASDLERLLAAYEAPAVALGRMLGGADLLSQVADRSYPERCYYHLYPELVLGGGDRVRGADGEERLLYRDALDLLRNTPRFYERVVRKRLDVDFRQVTRHLAAHFRGADPYADAIRRNLDRVARVLAEGRPELLGRRPVTTTRNLAPIFKRRPASPRRAAPPAPAT